MRAAKGIVHISSDFDLDRAQPRVEVRQVDTLKLRELRAAGAHYVIDTVADLPALLDEIAASDRQP